MLDTLKHLFISASIRKKILFTIAIILVYRFFVTIPVPFVDIEVLRQAVSNATSGMQMFAMLMGGSLQKFSIVALGLIPFINASIIIQLLTVVIPYLEELKEEGEVGNIKIQQYTRWLTLPLAFLQSIGMVYLISTYIPGVINTGSFSIVLLAAFSLTVGTILLVWLGELITEKGITNGTSLIIFASIIAGMTTSLTNFITPSNFSGLKGLLLMMIIIMLGLIVLSIILIRTKKEIPIIYAKAGKIEEKAILPIPLNPVGMVPIIFAIAFISFPYLLVNVLYKFHPTSAALASIKTWVENHLNIYSNNPDPLVVILYFFLIVLFTFFYSWVVFKPEKMAEQIQKRGGYIPGYRPGEETAKYLNSILMHLCFWGGIGLGLIGIYTYVINWIPFVRDVVQSSNIPTLPVLVSGAGIIIIVGVVQDIVNKLNAELLMEKYSKIV